MKNQKRRVKVGDICELGQGNEQRGFVQYLGESGFGSVIAVFPKMLKFCESSSETEQCLKDAYQICFPLKAAVQQGIARIVAHLPPKMAVPEEWRRPFFRPSGGVEKWIINFANGSTKVIPSPLAPEFRSIAVGEVWNYEYLLEKIRENWNPKQYV